MKKLLFILLFSLVAFLIFESSPHHHHINGNCVEVTACSHFSAMSNGNSQVERALHSQIKKDYHSSLYYLANSSLLLNVEASKYKPLVIHFQSKRFHPYVGMRAPPMV